MKHWVSDIFTFLFLSFLSVFFPSCKKEIPSPDYPQLIGIWSGSTSQGQEVKISINNLDGVLYVTYYKLSIAFNSGGQRTIEHYNTDGIASLVNLYFNIPLGTGVYGSGFLNGTFNLTTMVLSGSYRCYNPTDPNDYTDGFYTAALTK
ncbi:MAG: hypothetical protein M0P47_02155 [Bacteroidales bacterium]|jgi:hypothetical protein|nr:hypothetical protein [Bacteroidales bacterium]